MLKSLPPVTPEIAKAAIFDSVRTNVIEKPGDAFAAPRSLLPLELFRNGGIGEFVAARFTPDFEFRPPGSVPFEKIVNICRFINNTPNHLVNIDEVIAPALLPLDNYPPLMHVMGTGDQVFTSDQATSFAENLGDAGVVTETLLVTAGEHGFDVAAIKFICQTLQDGGKQISSRGIVQIDLPSDAFVMPAMPAL